MFLSASPLIFKVKQLCCDVGNQLCHIYLCVVNRVGSLHREKTHIQKQELR